MYNFFSKRKNKNKNENLCQISFSLEKSGNIKTELLWMDLDSLSKDTISSLASEYSAIIFGLMKGHFEQDILKALKNGKETDNLNDTTFIDLIEYNCRILENMEKKIYSYPLISPSSVFKK